MKVEAPERIWAAPITDGYGEWQIVKDGLPRPVEYVRADKLEELAAENERLKEDRARFPDSPDDIGRVIEARIGNLKAGKKSAEDLAVKAFERAFRAEAALAEKDKEIAALREALGMMLKEHDILSGNYDVACPVTGVMPPRNPDRWPTAAETARRALTGGE